jgi:hypothetical protein
MIHEQKIRKIVIRVEFAVGERVGFVDAEVSMETLCNTPRLRSALDESMNNFIAKNAPEIRTRKMFQ